MAMKQRQETGRDRAWRRDLNRREFVSKLYANTPEPDETRQQVRADMRRMEKEGRARRRLRMETERRGDLLRRKRVREEREAAERNPRYVPPLIPSMQSVGRLRRFKARLGMMRLA